MVYLRPDLDEDDFFFWLWIATMIVSAKAAASRHKYPEEKRGIHIQPPRPQRHRSTRKVAGWSLSKRKRTFDILFSLAVLLAFAPVMPLIAICIRLSSKGPAIFAQKRVGRGGRLFSIYKFRSMAVGAEKRGAGLTKSGDHRVTGIGKWLRRFKLDELPQFYNVLRGDMSIVGPRPKLPEFADDLNLVYRPGITGAASLAFRREEEMLAAVPPHHVEAYYHQRIKPLKASIDARYALRATFRSDLRMIVSTLVASLKKQPDQAIQSREIRTRARAGLFAVHLSQIRTARPLDHVTAEMHDR